LFLPFDPQWNPAFLIPVDTATSLRGHWGVLNTAIPQKKFGKYRNTAKKSQNTAILQEGCVGIWPIFGSVFRFSHLKTAVFRFWCLVRFAGFLQYSRWFSVFVNHDGGFSDFSVQCILRFFWFVKEVTPCITTKTL